MAEGITTVLKIGLSNGDKSKMREDILKQVAGGTPHFAGTTDEINGLKSDIGVVVEKTSGNWWYFDPTKTDSGHPNGQYVDSLKVYCASTHTSLEVPQVENSKVTHNYSFSLQLQSDNCLHLLIEEKI